MTKKVYFPALLVIFLLLIQAGCKKDNETNINNGDSNYDEYLISMKGGGGYYTETIIKFICTSKPVEIYGKGNSDASDGTVRVGISNSPDNFNDFSGNSYQKISGANSTFYVLLNSKWGTDTDTYANLKVKLPQGGSINYQEYDDHDDDLDYVIIEKQ